MSDNKIKDQAQQAVNVGTEILEMLMKTEINEITAQAALGNAWFRMCMGLSYSPATFWQMLNGMGQMYEKEFDKRYK